MRKAGSWIFALAAVVAVITGIRLWVVEPGWVNPTVLEVELQAEEGGEPWQNWAHLYFNRGDGLSEEESRRVRLPSLGRSETVRFHLPYTDWESLRFDPVARRGEVSIRSVRLASGSEEKVWEGEVLGEIFVVRDNVEWLGLDAADGLKIRSTGDDPSFDLLIEPLEAGAPFFGKAIRVVLGAALLFGVVLFSGWLIRVIGRAWRATTRGWLTEGQKVCVLFGFGLVVLSYVLVARQVESEPVPQHLAGYNLYFHLTEAYLHGQLHLLVEPVGAVKKMENPFDPVLNRDLRFHDTSYYDEKYFVYFGPAPVISLYLPWRVLTGCDLPDRWAGAILLSGALAFLILILLRIQRALGWRVSGGVLIGCVLILGISTGAPDLMGCSIIYQVALASAFFWMALCLLLGMEWSARSGGWSLLVASGFALGMAMASRHSFVLVGAFFCGWFFLRWVLNWPGFKSLLARCVALGGPVVAVGLILLLHNQLRFDDPAEFGHNHQIGLVDPNVVEFLDPANIPYNGMLNLFQPPAFTEGFPFVRYSDEFLEWVSPAPAHYGLENALGLLVANPFLLLLPVVFILARGKQGRGPPTDVSLAAWVLLLSGFFVIQFGVIASFSFTVSRYSLDYLPWLLLLFVILWSAVASRQDGVSKGIGWFSVPLIGWSLFVNLGLALERIL